MANPVAMEGQVEQCSMFNNAFRNGLAKKATVSEVCIFVKDGEFSINADMKYIVIILPVSKPTLIENHCCDRVILPNCIK